MNKGHYTKDFIAGFWIREIATSFQDLGQQLALTIKY